MCKGKNSMVVVEVEGLMLVPMLCIVRETIENDRSMESQGIKMSDRCAGVVVHKQNQN